MWIIYKTVFFSILLPWSRVYQQYTPALVAYLITVG